MHVTSVAPDAVALPILEGAHEDAMPCRSQTLSHVKHLIAVEKTLDDALDACLAAAPAAAAPWAGAAV